MAKGYTLDTRTSLYGEPRLSDAQVIALRAIATNGPLSGLSVATLRTLEKRLLVNLALPKATEAGRKILAAIDAAAGAS